MAVTPTRANTHISADWANLLEPGLAEIFFNTLDSLDEQYSKIFHTKPMDGATIKEMGMGAFTAWTERVNETDNVNYQKINEGIIRTFTNHEFASGFMVGKRLYEDEMYNIINKLPADLADAGKSKVETDAALMLNNAFTTTLYDTVPLISAAHPYEAGLAGTQSNLVTGALSDVTLQNAITLGRVINDEGGKKKVFTPDTLIIPPQLEWRAKELLESDGKVDTGDNNKNTLKGRLKYVVYDYLTSATAWFLVDSRRHGMNFYWRTKPEFAKSNDSDNFVAKYNGRMRYGTGISHWQGVVGSLGT